MEVKTLATPILRYAPWEEGPAGTFHCLGLPAIIENHRIGNTELGSQVQPFLWLLAKERWKLITFSFSSRKQISIVPAKQNENKQEETFICGWGACDY